jgi:hypothetical protein
MAPFVHWYTTKSARQNPGKAGALREKRRSGGLSFVADEQPEPDVE